MNDEDITPRQRRRRRRLQEIQAQALLMVVEDGISEFSINQLADRLDLTPGALYRYFDSRDAILAAVEIEVLEGFDAYFRQLESLLQETDTLANLSNLSFGYVALPRLQPERFRLISQFVGGPDPILGDDYASDVVGPTLRVIRRFVTAIEEAQRDGSLTAGEPIERAAIIWSTLQGLLTHAKLTRLPQVPISPDRLVDELLRTLFVGWGATTDAVEEALHQKPDLDFYQTAMENSK